MQKEVRKKKKQKYLCAEHNSKSIFRRAQGNTEQEKGDVKLFKFSVETPIPQGKCKLFMTEQVLLSSTGTD